MSRLRLLIAALAFAPALAAAQVSQAALDDSTRTALRAVGLDADGLQFRGFYEVNKTATIGVGDTVRGPLVVLRGDAVVRGTVLGNVTAIFGNVTIGEGADVHGSALAYRGRVVVEGGRVRGAIGARPVAAAAAPPAPPMSRQQAITLAAGWAAMVLVVGLLALVVAGRQLDETARYLEQDFAKAFFVGVAAELGFLPLVLLAVVALTVTLLGILLIPFVLVAAPVALAGAITLGWLAAALLMGRAVFRAGAGNDRAAMLRALVPGALLLFAPWFVAAGLQSAGPAAVVARAAAFAIAWVAASAGLGAVVLTRASRRRPAPQPAAAGGWQTPTPIGGIAAARRPVPARPEPTAKG
jgi:hypothetical protein